MGKFEVIIGLEIHAQLNTRRKMFCGCDNDAVNKKPNRTTCPRCLGMPGTLPVANREAIVKTIQAGLAFGSKINPIAKFDRKHYFYPDLPKGYQISQYDQPFCLGGELSIKSPESERVIRLNRIHLEEDAGKLNHPKGKGYSLVDLNRSSTPLIEIVSEPDIQSSAEARLFMKLIQAELINQGISDADMEKGHLRCDANINIRSGDQRTPIVEIKNLNSFRFLQKALDFEIDRQKENFSELIKIKGKVTRGFDSNRGVTYSQRDKEAAADYRYFPEPDLPPIETDDLRAEAEKKLKKLISEKMKMVESKSELIGEEVLKVVTDKRLSKKLFLKIGQPWFSEWIKLIANNPELVNRPDALVDRYAEAIYSKDISSNLAKQRILSNQPFSDEILTDSQEKVRTSILKLIAENQTIVEKYRSGKKNVLGFFVGRLMTEFKGSVEPKIINKIIIEELEK
jgi:aspartyl-tRNA(Asn)/glutamyl-tRNA(Gln) amidotransferase subunit B